VSRPSQWALLGIILLGILFTIPTFTSAAEQPPFTTANGTWAIATNLIEGRGYSACESAYFPFCGPSNQTTAMREPLPVFLMSLAMRIFPSAYSGLIIQSLLYLGTAVVIHVTLRKRDGRVAVLAALLWITSIAVIREIENDTGDLSAAFFLALGLLYFFRGNEEKRSKNWILAGLFMGLASLSRTVLLGVSLGLGGIAFLLSLKELRAWKSQLLPALGFLFAIGLVASPWIIRNELAFGQPVIGSTLTGYNIYRMNYFIANDSYSPHYVGGREGLTAIQKLVTASPLSGLENEAQMQDVYMRAGLQIIAQHPLQYIGLSLYRFLPLWFDTGVNASYNVKPRLLDYVLILQQVFLLVTVTLSIIKNWKVYWPLIVILILSSGAYMAIGAQVRYLVDFMPPVVLLASQGVSEWGWIKSSKTISQIAPLSSGK